MFECIRLFNINRKKTESVEEEIDFGCTRISALSCRCQPFMPGSPPPSLNGWLLRQWLTLSWEHSSARYRTHFPPNRQHFCPNARNCQFLAILVPNWWFVFLVSTKHIFKWSVSPELTVSSIENYQLLRSFSLISLNALVSIICQSCTTVSFLSAPYPMCSGENLNGFTLETRSVNFVSFLCPL